MAGRPSPVTPQDARRRAERLVQQRRGGWAARDDARSAVLDVPLHPPTEDDVRRDESAARAWVDAWRTVLPEDAVVWADRRWPRVGRQRVPERLTLHGADTIASFAGREVATRWRLLDEQAGDVRAHLAAGAADEAIARVVRRHAATLTTIDPVDLDRALDVAAWLAQHPASGLRVRQVPVRGVGTKWLERHLGLVTSLHEALTTRPSLGLVQDQSLVRVRLLDETTLPGAPRSFGAGPNELARLTLEPRAVVVLENLETLLSLPLDDPALRGTVAVHGSGYALPRLQDVPWIAQASVVYWGDLDSHGLSILHGLRTWHPSATSILMDAGTLLAHRDLWDVEKDPATGTYPLLTETEQAALALLRHEGDARLEQERIPWVTALATLRAVLGA